jgi:hypothetical protein
MGTANAVEQVEQTKSMMPSTVLIDYYPTFPFDNDQLHRRPLSSTSMTPRRWISKPSALNSAISDSGLVAKAAFQRLIGRSGCTRSFDSLSYPADAG